MSRAGFVLVGGKSSRMGRDKALLPLGSGTLVEHIAGAVAAAAGSVMLIGDPARYSALGFSVIPDELPGAGPLAGIQAALCHTSADWNLVLACDLPLVSGPFLADLIAAAEVSGADCLLPAGAGGQLEPLCAVYHARCLPTITVALERSVRKVVEALQGLEIRIWPVADPRVFQNCNTPQDWSLFEHGGALI